MNQNQAMKDVYMNQTRATKATKATRTAGLGFIFVLLGLFSLLSISCTSIPDLDEEAPSQYFKAAEESSFHRNRPQTIAIYKLMQLRFAEDFAIFLEAEFSIAQIYFTWKNHDKEATEHYNNVIQFYDRPEIGTDAFPVGFRDLAKKNPEAIEKRSEFRFWPPKTYGVHSEPPNYDEEQ